MTHILLLEVVFLMLCTVGLAVRGIPCPLLPEFTNKCVCLDTNIECLHLENHTDFPRLFYRTDFTYTKFTVKNSTIASLQGNSFRSLEVRELFLNNISLAHVQRRAFQGLGPKLEALYISENKISELEVGTFDSLVEVIRMRLNGNRLKEIKRGHFAGLPKLKNLYLHNNRLWRVEPNSFPPGLNSITLHRNEMTSIPENLFHGLVMTQVNLRENRLSQIPDNLFRDLTNLKDLDLSWNNITSLTEDVFARNANLTRLDLALNVIDTIHPRTFGNLRELTFLDISNNQLSRIDPELLKSQSKLEYLYLGRNYITLLEARVFASLANLRVLRIERGDLRDLDPDSFSGLSSLTELILNDNMLGDPEHLTALSDLRALRRLDLSGNELPYLIDGLFERFWHLEYLNLAYNKLTVVSDEHIGFLPALVELNFRGNYIERVGVQTFTNVTSLERLDLGENELQGLRDGTFERNSHLVTLSLFSNPLWKFNQPFVGLGALRELNLNRTCIFELSANSLSGLDSLEVLRLDQCFLEYISAETFVNTSRLISVDLSRNDITAIDWGAFNIPRLKVLNISYNSLDSTNLENITSSFASLSLDIFDISYNLISNFSGISIDVFRSLSQLHLSGNPYECSCTGNTVWLRTSEALRDIGTAACYQPPENDGVKLVCFPDSCGTPTLQAFESTCNDTMYANLTDVPLPGQFYKRYMPRVCLEGKLATPPPPTTTEPTTTEITTTTTESTTTQQPTTIPESTSTTEILTTTDATTTPTTAETTIAPTTVAATIPHTTAATTTTPTTAATTTTPTTVATTTPTTVVTTTPTTAATTTPTTIATTTPTTAATMTTPTTTPTTPSPTTVATTTPTTLTLTTVATTTPTTVATTKVATTTLKTAATTTTPTTVATTTTPTIATAVTTKESTKSARSSRAPPVDTTMTETPTGTAVIEPVIEVSIEIRKDGDTFLVVWTLADEQRVTFSGFQITTYKNATNQTHSIYQHDLNMREFSLDSLEEKTDYVICVSVVVPSGSSAKGGKDCQIVSTGAKSAPATGAGRPSNPVIIAIAVVVIVLAVIVVVAVACVCARNNAKKKQKQATALHNGEFILQSNGHIVKETAAMSDYQEMDANTDKSPAESTLDLSAVDMPLDMHTDETDSKSVESPVDLSPEYSQIEPTKNFVTDGMVSQIVSNGQHSVALSNSSLVSPKKSVGRKKGRKRAESFKDQTVIMYPTDQIYSATDPRKKKLLRSESLRDQTVITYPEQKIFSRKKGGRFSQPAANVHSSDSKLQRSANWVNSFDNVRGEELAEQSTMSWSMFGHEDSDFAGGMW